VAPAYRAESGTVSTRPPDRKTAYPRQFPKSSSKVTPGCAAHQGVITKQLVFIRTIGLLFCVDTGRCFGCKDFLK
jgi:hypothetical protein